MVFTCLKVAELLIHYLDGELEDDAHKLLERHLCGCVPCAIYLHTYRDTIKLTHALPNEPLPNEFATRLKAMLEECQSEQQP